jgi:voltage-gated potassium channel
MNQFSHSKKGRLIKTGSESRRNLLRFNLALLFSLFTMIFILPVIPFDDQLLTRIILILIVISGLFAAEFNAKLLRFLLGLGTITIALTVISIFFIHATNLTILLFFFNTLFFIIVTAALVSHVAQADEVKGSTVICAINSYLLIGLSVSLLIVILDLFAPNSFTNIPAEQDTFSVFIYFAFVTLTTLGYGDISPITPLARSFSTFTALFGQLYLVIIMALIVGKYLNTKGSAK